MFMAFNYSAVSIMLNNFEYAKTKTSISCEVRGRPFDFYGGGGGLGDFFRKKNASPYVARHD